MISTTYVQSIPVVHTYLANNIEWSTPDLAGRRASGCQGRRLRQGTTSGGECLSWHRSCATGAASVDVPARIDDLLMQNKTVKLTLLILKINKLLYPHCAHSCPSPSAQQELPKSAASTGPQHWHPQPSRRRSRCRSRLTAASSRNIGAATASPSAAAHRPPATARRRQLPWQEQQPQLPPAQGWNTQHRSGHQPPQ